MQSLLREAVKLAGQRQEIESHVPVSHVNCPAHVIERRACGRADSFRRRGRTDNLKAAFHVRGSQITTAERFF